MLIRKCDWLDKIEMKFVFLLCMELEPVSWRDIKVGETYLHYSRNQFHPGPNTVTVREIWLRGSWAFIYEKDSHLAYYVEDSAPNELSVNNMFFKMTHEPYIHPNVAHVTLQEENPFEVSSDTDSENSVEPIDY